MLGHGKSGATNLYGPSSSLGINTRLTSSSLFSLYFFQPPLGHFKAILKLYISPYIYKPRHYIILLWILRYVSLRETNLFVYHNTIIASQQISNNLLISSSVRQVFTFLIVPWVPFLNPDLKSESKQGPHIPVDCVACALHASVYRFLLPPPPLPATSEFIWWRNWILCPVEIPTIWVFSDCSSVVLCSMFFYYLYLL